SFQTGGSTVEAARSKESSAWLSVVLTDWPPGPCEREKRHESSSGGTVMPRTMTSRLIAPRSTRGRDALAPAAAAADRAHSGLAAAAWPGNRLRPSAGRLSP